MIKQVLDFTVQGVESFLKANPSMVFYAFAYDCNAEYSEVNLCFNTEQAFAKTLANYQQGEYSEYYQSPEQINELKFNTGDWEYQCFETHHIFSEQALGEIFQALPEDDDCSRNAFVESIMEIFCKSLLLFLNTETYQKIPKSPQFLAFCIDHDEDFETAENRLNSVKKSLPI